MGKFISVRLSLAVILLSLLPNSVCDAQVIDLSTPKDPFTAAILESIRTGKPPSRIDGCAVSEEGAQVHYQNNRNFEESFIDHINDDNTIQVTTVDTKLSLLFEVRTDAVKCFRPGSIALVTIAECKEGRKGECDFSLPHTVYIRTEQANVLNWKYSSSAP